MLLRPESGAAGALESYAALVRRRIVFVGAIAVLVIVAFIIDLATGPSALGVSDVLRGLYAPAEAERATAVIIWEVRLPQALIALLVGAALSLAGAEMQTLLNNPMASPFTLGMSSAATFGAALAIVLGIGIPGIPASWIVPVNAFLFAFGSVLLLSALSRLRGTGGDSIVLFGIALFFTFNALVALTQFMASEQALQQLVFWTMGSLTRASLDKAALVALVLAVVVPFSMMSAWKLTALRLGEDRARSIGVNVSRLRLGGLLRASLLTGVAVAFVGTIAFIGLVGPHLARLMIGEDHRFFLPASALCGALILSLASCASKIIMPGVVLPIGLVTSLIGVPFFLALVLNRREQI
ncbi:iron ABC transporter permease [Hyphomicrobium sp.]|uniref:FecCD family ABC transporter permease n=1 Tax=Hyphomicrobium sp. TaxID=82 RepID=UPI002BDBBED4|nr:iron ABC transporter permease [Hyphomicrobium sp.]HRN88597.1 iron ABC transporter permease [Hyphomicrobium sp.]HRQ27146.1 iron ABC transporter permease [Hyphomicrobium sp.]